MSKFYDIKTKKFDFWGSKIILDDYFFYWVNVAIRAKFFFSGKSEPMHENMSLKNIHKNQKTYIILNGPSLKQQNIKSLKSSVLFFVNRGFKHEDYEYLKPKYHLIIDNKLNTGEWEISILDQILEKNPNVTLLLNSKWYYLDKFQAYKKKAKIYWINTSLFYTSSYKTSINLRYLAPGSGAFGGCMSVALYAQCAPINFMGFDGNGLAYEMLDSSSHFYGINEDNLQKTTKDYIRDLYMSSRSLRELHFMADYCKRKEVDVLNLTNGGLLDMFDRGIYLPE